MKEIDKKIVKLVELYMNKDLVEGCLVESFGNIYKFICWDFVNDKTYIRCLNENLDDVTVSGTYKIIGTLDITAILKYMVSKGYDFTIGENIYPFKKDERCGACDNYKVSSEGLVPLKPYTTYTQEEKEDLLDLLKKLGQK